MQCDQARLVRKEKRGEIFMKFGSSSSGCEPRPAKGEPAQPVASLATDAATRPAAGVVVDKALLENPNLKRAWERRAAPALRPTVVHP